MTTDKEMMNENKKVVINERKKERNETSFGGTQQV